MGGGAVGNVHTAKRASASSFVLTLRHRALRRLQILCRLGCLGPHGTGAQAQTGRRGTAVAACGQAVPNDSDDDVSSEGRRGRRAAMHGHGAYLWHRTVQLPTRVLHLVRAAIALRAAARSSGRSPLLLTWVAPPAKLAMLMRSVAARSTSSPSECPRLHRPCACLGRFRCQRPSVLGVHTLQQQVIQGRGGRGGRAVEGGGAPAGCAAGFKRRRGRGGGGEAMMILRGARESRRCAERCVGGNWPPLLLLLLVEVWVGCGGGGGAGKLGSLKRRQEQRGAGCG